jgi:hypothetical protein
VGKGVEMNEPKISVLLTRSQIDKLNEVLWDAQDEGPYGHGWASKEVDALRCFFSELVQELDKA